STGSFGPVLERWFAIDLSRSLLKSGDLRGAKILLRALMIRGGEPREARKALVELSREEGRRDMAGRWGILIPGLTTREEQRAFAGAVRARGGTASNLRELAMMYKDQTLTPEALQVLKFASGATGPSTK
ncbi:MAG: hypothetical protein KF844_09085, partial [Cryobacterium sp.]|nr:hypothetical protein [Cryobacterium sp.]